MGKANRLVRLKRFEVAERARRVTLLETMIRDFGGMALDLAHQIAVEEERTRIKDTAHVAYSTFAAAAAVRRRNLLISVADLTSQLELARRELNRATKQLDDLELARGAVVTMAHSEERSRLDPASAA
jgi:flagellar FliJ protein